MVKGMFSAVILVFRLFIYRLIIEPRYFTRLPWLVTPWMLTNLYLILRHGLYLQYLTTVNFFWVFTADMALNVGEVTPAVRADAGVNPPLCTTELLLGHVQIVQGAVELGLKVLGVLVLS